MAAAATVFVDDAIRGDLPDVCVKTGRPADITMTRRHRVGGGGLGVAWLLVLLGPLGFVVLILVAVLAPAGEQLTVRLPYTQAAFDAERGRRTLYVAMIGLGAMALLTAGLRFGPFPAAASALIGGALVLAGAVFWSYDWFTDVGIYLDVTRRWITLSRVHPAFARAVEARAAEERDRATFRR